MASCTDCDVCDECDGVGGWIHPPSSPHWHDCDVCGGSGRWRPTPTPDDDAFDEWRERNFFEKS